MAWLFMPVSGVGGPGERALKQPWAEQDALDREPGDQGVLWLYLYDLGQVSSRL